MKQKKLVSTEFRLLTYGNNLAQKWCWEWYDEKGKRCKKYGLINRHTTVESRLIEAEKLKKEMETGLKNTKQSPDSVIYQHLKPHYDKHVTPLRDSSAKDYGTVLHIFERWLLKTGYKALHPKKFAANQAEDYARYIEFERKAENATYNKHINVLDMLFDYLAKAEIITKSPFFSLKRKQKCSTSVSAFKEHDVQKLKEVLKTANMTVYIACMVDMYAFIRPNEIRNLRLKDIDMVNNTITIDKSFAKNKKTQKVAILPALQGILKEYISELKEQDFFLLSKKGTPGTEQISSKYVVENHNRIMQANGYNSDLFKPYSWKHTGNSLAYKNGASIRFLKLQNRHHSEVMTEIYIKSIVPEDLVSQEEQYFNF